MSPERGRDAEPNEPGELWVRGSQVMEGYYENPEATAATLSEDGWLRTGELVCRTEDGELEVLDRLKELIEVGGSSVAPAEIELVPREHPAVSDAGVIGAPDDRDG